MDYHTAFSNNQKMVSSLDKELGLKVTMLMTSKWCSWQANDVWGLATTDQNKSKLPAYELTILDQSIFYEFGGEE